MGHTQQNEDESLAQAEKEAQEAYELGSKVWERLSPEQRKAAIDLLKTQIAPYLQAEEEAQKRDRQGKRFL